MCYRPRPDPERSPTRKPTKEEIDRKVQRLEAELARLRQEQENLMKA